MDREKKLEELTDRLFEQLPLEQPSADFTKNILQQLEPAAAQSKFAYRPLISRKVLVAIYVLLAIVLVVAAFTLDFDKSALFQSLDVATYFDRFAFKVPSIEFSSTLSYALVGLGVMAIVQITLLKKQLEDGILKG